MNTGRTVKILLEKPLLDSAVAGQHNFVRLMCETLSDHGFVTEFLAIKSAATVTGGLTLSHMRHPISDTGLVFRRVYQYPFWQIEKSPERWQWDVARAGFAPDPACRAQADRFYRFWQKRLFGSAAHQTRRTGYVYVPLQGRLTAQRSFQKCTPLEMLELCLIHEPDRTIVATLHPKETLTSDEGRRLQALAQRHPRLRIETGNMERHLQDCDYVVTQNSGAAFAGYFFGKAALLFARIDFHHIAIKADMAQISDSFEQVRSHAPPFADYLWWFWQERSINAGRDDASARIAARFARFGWLQ